MEKMTDRMNARKYQFTKDADMERLLGSKKGLGTLDVAGEFRKNKKKTVAWSVPFNPEAQGTTVKSGAKSKVRYSDGVLRLTNWVGNVLEDTIMQIFANREMDVFVNIVKVEVVPSYSALKVWWEASGVHEKDKQTKQLLETQAGNLCDHYSKHTTELNILSETDVERVEFKDKWFDSHEVDSNICEGLSYSFDKELSVEEKGVEGNDSKRVRTSDFKFRQDLYGLHHDSLMKKVLDSKLARRPLAAVEEKETFNMDRLVFKQDKKRAYKPFKVSKRRLERLERQTYGYNSYDD
ncbi:hypothetical protein MAR_026844 [Mya arenaria]|uniref:Uncharacterized protein n=1 Tax=Mya arenaria TaxID=6604 RepID=A0ABY7EW72_MYAAR|nr:hypothetical protein MAR_026844 [Mya arenaria]